MDHVLPTIAVFIASGLVVGAWVNRWPRGERVWAWAAFAAHTVSAFAMLWIILEVYDGIGDAFTYLRRGEELAAYMRLDLFDHGADVLSLILHGSPRFPFLINGVGQSTGTMAGVGAIAMLLFGSIWASSLALCMLSFTGQLALYVGLRRHVPASFRSRLAVATLLLPSVVFWTSGVQKEALMMLGLGWTIFALSELEAGRVGRAMAILIPSSLAIGLVKPYVYFPLAAALAVWLYWRRATAGGVVRIRPIALIVAGALSLIAVILLGQLFPAYSLDNFAETVAIQQHYGRAVGGGSFVETGNPEVRSLAGQFAYAPMALVSSLFRPFLFEVSNAMMLINALETTALTLLLAYALFTQGIRSVAARVWSSPMMMGSATLVVLLGIGVGLGTTNLGTLSRYRLPMMPFFAILLLGITHRSTVVPRREPSRAMGDAFRT